MSMMPSSIRNSLLIFIILFSLVLDGGCISKKIIQRTPGDKFNLAMEFYISHDYNKAISILHTLLKESPPPDVREKSIFYLGKIYAVEGNYPMAVSYLTQYIRNYPKGDYFYESVCILSGIKPQIARNYLESVNFQIVPAGKWKGYCLLNMGLLLWENGDRIPALYKIEDSTNFLDDRYVVEIIKSGFYSLSVTQKESVGFYGRYLNDLFILFKASQGDFWSLKKFKEVNDPQIMRQYDEIEKQRDLVSRQAPLSIYVLLPLNGAYAPIGTRLLEDTFYALRASSPSITIGNTWGDRIFTRLFLKKINRSVNPVSLGPVLSWDLKEAIEINTTASIPIMTINSSLPDIKRDRFTFRINLTPRAIVKKLVNFAMDRGIKEFAIFRPKSEYGETYATLFSQEVVSRGGRILWEIDYPEKTRDFRYYFWKVLNIKDKDEEEEFFKTLKEKKLEVPVQAVFIPDNWNTVSFLIPQFGYFGMNKLTFLCTRDAINPRNTDILGDYEVYAAASFYPFSNTPSVERMEEEFENRLGRVPNYWDAYQLIAVSILESCMDANTREEFRQCITREEGFNTFLGKLRIKWNGEAEIPLKIFTIKDDEWTEITQ